MVAEEKKQQQQEEELTEDIKATRVTPATKWQL